MGFGSQYYYLVAGLPELTRDARKLPMAVEAFRELAGELLSAADREVMDLFFLPRDNAQVLRLLRGEAPDAGARTVFPLAVLEEAVAEPTGTLPGYLEGFIADFKAERWRHGVSPENELAWGYYDCLLGCGNGFAREYARFSLEVKNVVTALNCRRHGLDAAREVVGEGELARALRTSTARDFGVGADFPVVERVLALVEEPDLVARERGLDGMAWDFIEEALTFEYFSLDRVLGFLLELMMLERWSRMSPESGRRVFMELVERFRRSFEFADTFK